MVFILIIITVLSIIFSIYCLTNKIKLDSQTKEKNNNLKKEYDECYIQLNNKKSELTYIIDNIAMRERDLSKVIESIGIEQKRLSLMKADIDDTYKNAEERSRQAFLNYCDVLMNSYKEKDEEYTVLLENLVNAYAQKQEEILRELDKENAELDKIRSTRTAALEAQIKEKQIKEELSFYCLPLSDIDKADIDILETIKPKLNKPRVLSMLIWSTFFQKPMTTLCNNILGTTQVTGIYKITNQKNNMCYIGQAVDMADRWKQHAKCGLGIDTPAANKLYKAMQEDGINNFSWELIEKCPKEQLNEKEKYYIDLYDSCNFGYNSNIGVSKK